MKECLWCEYLQTEYWIGLKINNINEYGFKKFVEYVFLHTHFYVCQIRIFTKKMVTKIYVCHTYGKYVFLRIPKPKNTYIYVCHTYF